MLAIFSRGFFSSTNRSAALPLASVPKSLSMPSVSNEAPSRAGLKLNQFLLRPNAFSTKLKSNTWLGGISLVTAKLFLVKSMAPRIHASSK